MRDMVDVFIKQSMKNWAARQQSPVSGRARLLLLASSRSRINETDDIDQVFSASHKHSKYIIPLVNSPSPVEQVLEPISQTRLWLLQISPSPLRNVT